MPEVLGPRAKRVDILAYKGVTWASSFTIDIDNVLVNLTAGVLVADVRKSYDTAIVVSFVFEPVSSTEKTLTLRGSDTGTVATGLSEDDPKSKFVYDVLWKATGLTAVVVAFGVLTLAPVSSNVPV